MDQQTDRHEQTDRQTGRRCTAMHVCIGVWLPGLWHPQRLVSTDFSTVVIDRYQKQYPQCEYGHFVCAEMAAMTDVFPPGHFDVVFEKCSVDALTCLAPEQPWMHATDMFERVRHVLCQIHTLLRPGGTFVSVTYNAPHFWMHVLDGHNPFADIQLVNTVPLPLNGARVTASRLITCCCACYIASTVCWSVLWQNVGKAIPVCLS